MICLGVDWIEELVAHWSSSASYVSSPQFLWKLIRQKVIVFHANFFFTIRIQKAGLTKVAFGVVSKRFKKVVVKQMYFIIISFKKTQFQWSQRSSLLQWSPWLFWTQQMASIRIPFMVLSLHFHHNSLMQLCWAIIFVEHLYRSLVY